uniref:Uncharacterized protein n=1 Tax=Rhipicephalus zambeziensis TaxID=60191 RepID=A0A224Y632_9ACAR
MAQRNGYILCTPWSRCANNFFLFRCHSLSRCMINNPNTQIFSPRKKNRRKVTQHFTCMLGQCFQTGFAVWMQGLKNHPFHLR